MENQRGSMFQKRENPFCQGSISRKIPEQNSAWCKIPLCAAQEGNSCNRQLLVYFRSLGRKLAVTDVTKVVQRGRCTHTLHQPQPESHCHTETI